MTDLLDFAGPLRPTLRLTPQALVTLNEYRARIEPRLGPGGDLHHIADWGSKIQGDVVRLAALLHMAEHQEAGLDVDIEPDTIERAVTLADYLIQHALAAFDEMGADPLRDASRSILEWLRATKKVLFTKRDAHNALRGRFPRASELDKPLKHLEEHGYIRLVPQKPSGKAGRPASPIYHVNPYVHEQNPRNPQKPGDSTDSADSAAVKGDALIDPLSSLAVEPLDDE